MSGSVDIRLRPIKLAYLVDPGSAKQVRQAIALSSTLWGGTYFPIVPLYRRMPSSWRDGPIRAPKSKGVVLGYLDAFDPDILVRLSRSVPDYISELGIEVVDQRDIWSTLKENWGQSPKFGIGIFELLNGVYKEFFEYKRKYPIRIVLPAIPREMSLFWASFLGEVAPDILKHISRNYRDALDIEFKKFEPSQLAEIMKRDVIFPRRIVEFGLENSRRYTSRSESRLFFLDATKTEDIIDYWNLRALGGSVLPVPKQLENHEQLRHIIIEFLKQSRRPWRHNPKVCDHATFIRSRNSTMDEMQSYAKTLRIEPVPNDPSDSPYFGLQHWYPRIWDEWGRDKDAAVPEEKYSEKELSVDVPDANARLVHTKPVLPEFAQKFSNHDEPRCANEVSYRFYDASVNLAEVFPRPSGQAVERVVAGFGSLKGEWRVGRNGLVKLVSHNLSESRAAPEAERVFFAWLQDQGWNPKLSAPGLLAKQIHKRLGGSIGILKNEKLIMLLERMNGGRVREAQNPIGEEEYKLEEERELPVGEVKKRLLVIDENRNLHDNLLAKQVFKLGVRIQCPHCIRKSWFGLDGIQEALLCPRCLNAFPALGHLDGGDWCYKTVGPFSVGKYADGAYTVLLSLEFLSRGRMGTVRTTPVFSFSSERADGTGLEADFAALWQEPDTSGSGVGVLFGECKTYGKFEKQDFARMRYLGKLFPGAILAFCTLRTTLTKTEIAGIASVAKSGRKYWKSERPLNPVLVLTGSELLSWHGPPYCWDEATQKRFRHWFSLVGLCDATQQIHLQMPSWHEDWNRNSERRRARWEARQQQGTLRKGLNVAAVSD